MGGDEQVVYSAGNSWVVCRSKSHSGRIYYFNTLTGEAAWNLSPAEIEKAKTRTKTLSKQENINIEACPEPKEPPIDQTKEMSDINQASSSSTIYNKQVINNRFSKPSYSIPPVIIPPYSHLVANQLNAIVPLALNTQNTGYNTNVWAVPPSHQIFIGQTIPPLVNQGQTAAVNVEYGNYKHTAMKQNTATSLSGRFKYLQSKGFNSTPPRKLQWRPNFTSPKDNKRFEDRNYSCQKNFKQNLGVNDLRQVLSAKKRVRRTSAVENEIDEEQRQETDQSLVDDLPDYTSGSEVNMSNEEQQKENDGNNADSDWIEENIVVEDSRLKLNISNLKNMAKPDMKQDCWYIVADKDILLNHLYFLNTLCNSDDDCCLMVAQRVVAELHELSRGAPTLGDARRARRAVSFLHKQLDDGYVFIGDGACAENGTRCDYLLNCCSNLLEENYHVILLSNDDELKSYKNCTNIPIFNIKEIKQFLTKSALASQHNRLRQAPESKTPEINKTDRLKPPPCQIKPLLQSSKGPIKITVANDLVPTKVENLNSCKVNKGIQVNSDYDKNNETVDSQSEVVNHLDSSISHVKLINEVAVQTDIEYEPSVSNNIDSTFTPICQTKDAEKTHEQEKEVNKTSAQSARKEIRLNRSISAKTTTSSEDSGAEKKHFKWRRKRYFSGTTTNDSKMCSGNSSNNVDENSRDSVNVQKVTVEQQLPLNKSEESICSETSSLVINRNQYNGSVIIEETSTSGIISNSTSNVDSESESGNKLTSSMLSNSKQSERINCVVYKITDKVMEDSLRMMNDEWISRFTQIMEEVLTQVLQKNERFLVDVVYKLHGGGPWTIWEAADCIKIKFSNDCDIVDAANKLTNVFKRISDHTGRITANLEPSEYMEMYSFGVYLISSLQRAQHGCEDLGSAARALSALLHDIRNPNLDSSHHDAFGDQHPQDTPLNVCNATPLEQNEQIEPVKPMNQQETTEGTATSNSPRTVNAKSYNLRSRFKTQNFKDKENDKEENVTFIRKFDVQNSFFDSLKLIKKPVENSSPVTKSIPSPQAGSSDPEDATSSQGLIRSIFDRNLSDSSQRSKSNENINSTEATVIRKFTVFPEFEKKIKRTVVREPLDMDQLDYSAMFNEDDENFMNEEYYSDNEYYENAHDSQVNETDVKTLREGQSSVENCRHNGDALSEDSPVIQTCEGNIYLKNCDDKQFVCDSPLNMNKNLNKIFSTIIRRVKEAFFDIENFCKETYKELSESQVHSIKRKYEINENAEKIQIILDNLCKSLNNILYRETCEPEKNIQSLLKDEGINDFNLNDNQLNLYRDVVSKCIEQARILQESVSLIVSIIRKQPIE